jgi:hypothetical protein
MMLRLALVGIVAALGVTLPSQTSSDQWLVATERWASSVFACWDTWSPQDHAPDIELMVAAERDSEPVRIASLPPSNQEERESAVITAATFGPIPAPAVVSSVAVRDQPAEAMAPDAAPTDGREKVASGLRAAAGTDSSHDHPAGWQVIADSALASTTPEEPSGWAAIMGNFAESPAVTGQTSIETGALTARWRPVSADTLGSVTPLTAHPAAQERPAGYVLPEDAFAGVHDEAGDALTAEIAEAPFIAIASVYGEDLYESVAVEMERWQKEKTRPEADGIPKMPFADEPAPAPLFATPADERQLAGAPAPVPFACVAPPGPEADRLIPWPVFAPQEGKPARVAEIAQETTVPWPVFAPANAPAAVESVALMNPSPTATVDQFTGHRETLIAHKKVECPPVSASADTRSTRNERAEERVSQRDAGGLPAAIQLTQQAMRAWIDVLSGPARVEVTAR